MKTNKILIALVLLFSVSSFSSAVESNLFFDDFNRTTLNPEGQTTYTVSGKAITPVIENNMLKLIAPIASTTYGYGNVVGDFSSFDPQFKPELLDNNGLLTWRFNTRHNYNGRLIGFNSSRAVAMVLLADGADFSTANGYAIVQSPAIADGSNCYWALVKFTNGLATIQDLIVASQTNLAPVPHKYREFFSLKVTFDPASKTWSLYDRIDGPSTGGAFIDPYSDSPAYTSEGTYVDTDLTATSTFSHFGFTIYASAGTAGWNLWFDNFGVSKTVSDPVAVNDLSSDSNLWISGSKLMIATQGVAKVEIVSMNGMMIQSENMIDRGFIELDKGQYIVRITTERETTVKKILIP